MWPESHLLCCRVYSCLLSMIIFVWFQTLHILHLHHESRIRWSAIDSFLLRCGRLNNQTYVFWISKKYRTSIRSLLPGAMSLHSFLGFLLLLAAACSAADSTGGLKRCWSYIVADEDFAFICSHVSAIYIYFPFIFHLFGDVPFIFHKFTLSLYGFRWGFSINYSEMHFPAMISSCCGPPGDPAVWLPESPSCHTLW